MKNFQDLLSGTMEYGVDQFNARTGIVCRAIVGIQIQFSMDDGFSAVTTKKLAFNGVKGELLGFFRGCTSAADFRALGCKVWDENANVTPAWLNNPYRKGEDDLGPIYGKQWTAWLDRRIVGDWRERDALIAKGYKVRMVGTSGPNLHPVEWLMEREINQLENALQKLLTDPSDRGIIVSGYNVGELDMMALRPCHMDYRFVAFDGPTADDPKELHVVMTIRSWDLFLGAPFNIASTALFLHIMARLAGMTPGIVTIQATNAHIYENHFDQVKEQLTRKPFHRPELILSDNIRPIKDLKDVNGAFTRIEPSDIVLKDYVSHEAIKAKMAV